MSNLLLFLTHTEFKLAALVVTLVNIRLVLARFNESALEADQIAVGETLPRQQLCPCVCKHGVENVLTVHANPTVVIFQQISCAHKESAKSSRILAPLSGDAGFFPGLLKLFPRPTNVEKASVSVEVVGAVLYKYRQHLTPKMTRFLPVGFSGCRV